MAETHSNRPFPSSPTRSTSPIVARTTSCIVMGSRCGTMMIQVIVDEERGSGADAQAEQSSKE
jgi:hypothetical protein